MHEALLMPVYNEVATVGAVLNAVRRHFDGKIVVVDDGSTDETARILSARDDITAVHLDRNCGYGVALEGRIRHRCRARVQNGSSPWTVTDNMSRRTFGSSWQRWPAAMTSSPAAGTCPDPSQWA